MCVPSYRVLNLSQRPRILKVSTLFGNARLLALDYLSHLQAIWFVTIMMLSLPLLRFSLNRMTQNVNHFLNKCSTNPITIQVSNYLIIEETTCLPHTTIRISSNRSEYVQLVPFLTWYSHAFDLLILPSPCSLLPSVACHICPRLYCPHIVSHSGSRFEAFSL